jgi:hypothetical protein
MSLREKAAAARSALEFYLDQLQQLAWSIEDGAPEDEIRECLDLATQPTGRMREAHAEVEEALVGWFVAHGRPKIKTGDLEWWVGKQQTVKVVDRKAQIMALVETIEEETGIGLADEERKDWCLLLGSLLAANALKHGALMKFGDESKRAERWESVFRREYSEGLRVKSAPDGVRAKKRA